MYEKLFSLASLVMPFWIVLIIVPKWRVTRFLVNNAVFPIYLAALYVIGIIITIAGSGLGFVHNFGSVEGVTKLLSQPNFAILVWLHILCFDQTIGHYVFKDNMEHRYLPIPVQSIILFLILMFGPLGFLCYLILRKILKKEKKIFHV
ncbi:ABA4-like family protein [Bacillus sp. S/N-304-OC-R1]|uniref:ABA4-like family protein n=1 Tax=Bacillus sp. S/N-304-OC-R1 TaxID=2758034 RepID=UPI001C8EF9F2|nr:ABA4-like family protein [Bacillus sp. S/N-304-OC-R1]MBY0121614.1 DUF4281 domain-containing protein [Bacillus sp. S/N-304-OC-R1]